jgi:hypothetical protein
MLAAKDSHETAATQFVQSEATAWRIGALVVCARRNGADELHGAAFQEES